MLIFGLVYRLLNLRSDSDVLPIFLYLKLLNSIAHSPVRTFKICIKSFENDKPNDTKMWTILYRVVRLRWLIWCGMIPWFIHTMNKLLGWWRPSWDRRFWKNDCKNNSSFNEIILSYSYLYQQGCYAKILSRYYLKIFLSICWKI